MELWMNTHRITILGQFPLLGVDYILERKVYISVIIAKKTWVNIRALGPQNTSKTLWAVGLLKVCRQGEQITISSSWYPGKKYNILHYSYDDLHKYYLDDVILHTTTMSYTFSSSSYNIPSKLRGVNIMMSGCVPGGIAYIGNPVGIPARWRL